MHPVLALFKRNAWATDRLLVFCDGRPEVTAPAEDDVFGSIAASFNHLLGAEPGYMRLVTGSLPLDLTERRPLAELRAPAKMLADGWLDVLTTERDPEPVLPYQRGRDPEMMADWVPLVQTPHHGDDHRTQIGTLLSRHGVEPPDLDGWAFGKDAAGDGEARGWWDALLDRFFGHHLWATQQLLEHCRGLSPERLALAAAGTYGSIGDTLDHLVSSDRSYLSRLNGTGRQEPLNAGGPEKLLEHFARQREGWLAYLASKPDFEAPVEVRGRGQVPAWVIVMQAIHHGNDHRTNVGTVLLHHALEAPEIDVWAYAWDNGSLRPLAAESDASAGPTGDLE